MPPLKYRQSEIMGHYSLWGGAPAIATAVSSADSLNVSINNTPGNDHPFEATHKVVAGSIIHSTQNDGVVFWENCPSNFYNISISGLLPPDSDASSLLRLLAHTNPARPELLLPNILWEMRDLPDMIRQGGRIADALRRRKPWRSLIRPGSAVRDAAAANLAIQFGWLPFISDLASIAGFQKSLDRTKDKFAKLKSGKGLRAGMRLYSHSSTSKFNFPLWSVVRYFEEEVTVTQSVQQWGIARWKPQASFQFPSSDAEFSRRALGLTPDAITLNVWESLPWSWLIDYFTNVGRVLGAQNHVVATAVSGCVMTQSKATATHPPFAHPTRGYSGGSASVTANRRGSINDISISPGDILGRIPVLSGSQLSVLGSLAVARAR